MNLNLVLVLLITLSLYQQVKLKEGSVKTFCNVTLSRVMDNSFEMIISEHVINIELREIVSERRGIDPIFLQVYTSNDTFVIPGYESPRKYEGHSTNYEGVSLTGFLKNNYFHGMVQFTDKDEVYFIDEHTRVIGENWFSFKTSMHFYQGLEQTRETLRNGTIGCTIDSKASVKYHCPNLRSKTSGPAPKRQTIVKKVLHLCSLELIADPTFFEEFGPSQEQVFLKMYKHISFADALLRRTDFDDNSVPDGVGLIVRKVTMYQDWHNLLPSLYHRHTINGKIIPDEYLDYLSKRNNDVCLVISFCHRSFTEAIVGVAYVPDMNNPTQFGGICERAIKYQDGSLRRLNVVAITTKSSGGHLLPDALTTSTVIHEIGHAFGSSHDDSRCSPRSEQGGPYIMHPHTLEGYQSNNYYFSPCSRRQISKLLRSRRSCLETNHTGSWCGNGVKELGEECDCGMSDLCHILDPCCNPPRPSTNTSQPTGCTYKEGYNCSHKTDPCCTEQCTISTGTIKRICHYQQGLCKVPNICDGTSQFCPKNDTFNDTQCEAEACVKSNLETCVCPEDDCKVCCVSGNVCGNLIITGHAVLLPEGSSCWGGSGICNKNGVCISSDEHKRQLAIIYFLPLIAFIFIISMVCLMPVWCKIFNQFRE